ncbi:MAG: hypothetical protein H6737_03155 [Alphaproteobacteria bacterium]|nr:hypothetical protein [Alphaproteobacteria bacterium]
MATQIVAVASTVSGIFVVLNWVGACDPLFDTAARKAVGDEPLDMQAMRAHIREENAAKRGEKPAPKQPKRTKPEPTLSPTFRAPGAFYPDEHVEDDAGWSIDPLMLAVVGGAMIFGLAGAGTFLMMGGLGGKEPEKPEPAGDEPIT